MESELKLRKCPFCGSEPDAHAYRTNNGKLSSFSIACDVCAVQPHIILYGENAQREASEIWNGVIQ